LQQIAGEELKDREETFCSQRVSGIEQQTYKLIIK
jgi:hypothetical protein